MPTSRNNVARRKASVGLVLNLLCSTAEEKIERSVHFAPDAPLVGKNLIHLIREPNHLQPSLLSYCIMLDEQITNLLSSKKDWIRGYLPFVS